MRVVDRFGGKLVAIAGVACVLGVLACGSGGSATPTPSAPALAIGVKEQAPVKTVVGGFLHDVTYDSAGRQVRAYLVVPDGRGPFAPVLFAHWYTGRNGADRSEFLEEATGLLKLGVVSLLPQGQFPWKEDPSGIGHDQAAIANQVADLKAGLDVLLAQAGVDSGRAAFVGHDYGAMHGVLLLASDPRVKAAVLMAADAQWVTWFGAYWSFLKTDVQKADYARQMAALDPVALMPRVKAALLLQFANQDEFISRAQADQVAAAASSNRKVSFYDSSHELNAAAASERRDWLTKVLALV